MATNSQPLNSAVLRISGSDAALDQLVLKLNLEVNTRHRYGDPGPRGLPHATSGLNASIADGIRPAALIVQLRNFLNTCLALGSALFTDVDAEVSLGVSVGDDDQFVVSLDLSKMDLRDLSALGLTLNFTAYPPWSPESGQP
jgi:hypothetical protein